MMARGWGGIPAQAWKKAYQAYGAQLLRGFEKALALIGNADYLGECLSRMQMDKGLLEIVPATLQAELERGHQAIGVPGTTAAPGGGETSC